MPANDRVEGPPLGGRQRRRTRVATSLLVTVASVAAALVAVTAPAVPADATPATPAVVAATTTPYTFTAQTFDGTPFPPAGWETTSGTWTQDCPAPPVPEGCAAVATVTADFGQSELRFNPGTAIPADLEDATLSFTSNFTPDPTTGVDVLSLRQGLGEGGRSLLPGDGGDFAADAPGVPVTHTFPLAHLNLPLIFRWYTGSFGSTTPSETWAISNVSITGNLPVVDYALTADPIVNTQYHPISGGSAVTVTLSGSSDPAGDTLGFEIVDPPQLGHLGTINSVDSTHATVSYSVAAQSCKDPDGTPGLFCTDHFTYKATDATGHQSAPVNAAFDITPGGAFGVPPTITAPGSMSYVTLIDGQGQPQQGVDLSTLVSVGPNDYPDAVELKLHVRPGGGTLTAPNAGSIPGVTFLNGTSSPGEQLDLRGSTAKLSSALGLLTFFPPAGTTPSTAIDVFARDLGPRGSGPFGDVQQATILINGINTSPPPVLSAPSDPLSVANTGGPLAFPPGSATGFSLVDAGASANTNDTVTLSVDAGTLALPPSDTVGSPPLVTVQSADSGATLTITGTVANLNTALSHLTFDASTLGARTVTLTAFAVDPDTGLASTHVTASITVIQGPNLFGPTSTATLQNVPVTLFLCASGPAGAALSYTFTAQPQHGTLTVDPTASAATSGCSLNGTKLIVGYTYAPASGYTGPDAFTYYVTDATTGLSSAAATFTITVSPHTKPTAYATSVSTRQDQAVDFVLCGLNPDPNPKLTFSLVSSTSRGGVVDKGSPLINSCANGNESRTFTYTPFSGQFASDGTDSFSYRVSNGADSDPVTVSIAVATRTPQVASRQLDVDENGSLGFFLCSSLPNAPVSFSTVGPSHGTIDQQPATTSVGTCPNGLFALKYVRYVPAQLFTGTDLISYQATDGTYTSAQAFVTITVHGIEIPPTADGKSVTVIAPHSIPITLTGSSVHQLPLTFRVTSGPSRGTLGGTAPDLVYTPTTASGTDTFTYVANDGVADSPPATVTVTIVTPQLSSSVCRAGTPEIGPSHFPCAGSLTAVADGSGGTTNLAHTSGDRNAQLRLQVTVTNHTAISDTVRLTAPAGVDPWAVRYAVAGADVTDELTGAGLLVTLGPAGSATGSTYVVANVIAPSAFPSPPSTSLVVTATSGNDAARSTAIPIRVMDGTSAPSLGLTQADGSGQAADGTLTVTPPLIQGGPDGGAQIVPAFTGTGAASFRITARPEPGSADVTPQYFLGTTDITAAVTGTGQPIDCYILSCAPIRVVLHPGTGAGTLSLLVTQTSTIDGQSRSLHLDARMAGTVQPDLYATIPVIGQDVYEATPSTQTADVPAAAGGTSTKRVFLHNDGDSDDTYVVRLDVTTAAGDASTFSATVAPPGSGGQPGTPADATAALRAGTYRIALRRGAEAVIEVTDHAGAVAGLDPAVAVLTATSTLAFAKVDSFRLAFPSFFYRPDAVLEPSADGLPARGIRVYDDGTNQRSVNGVDQSTIDIPISFSDRGLGRFPAPATDAVVVKAPPSTADFTLTYRLTTGGTSRDVTAAVTGAGLDLALFPNGGPPETMTVSVTSPPSATTGRSASFPITVTSSSSVPTGLSDTLVLDLHNLGQSELRFAGLPQPEPQDVVDDVRRLGLGDRVPPIFADAPHTGEVYGAYPDLTGQKFVYGSVYDTVHLQVGAQKEAPTRYRVQLVAPGLQGQELPYWQRVEYAQPYYNAGVLEHPANPLDAATSVVPTIHSGSRDVTAQVLAGTFTTEALSNGSTADLAMTFAPRGGPSRRYTPLKVNLINADTGKVEDVLVLGLSGILQCSEDGYGQQLAKITGPDGTVHRLAFRSFDRTGKAGATECLQRLGHAWVSHLPVVFSSYQKAVGDTPAGGLFPNGFWLYPQGAQDVIRIDADTLEVTSTNAKAYADTEIVGEDGTPDPTTFKILDFVGIYHGLRWRTADPTTGLQIDEATTLLAETPFPLIAPRGGQLKDHQTDAARYVVVNPDGMPVIAGTMMINQPWFKDGPQALDFGLPVLNTTGTLLNYQLPREQRLSLPGFEKSSETYWVYFKTQRDGTVVQGGCILLDRVIFSMLGIDDTQFCPFYVFTTFKPISRDPSVPAKFAKVEFGLVPAGLGDIGPPNFLLSALHGSMSFDPFTGTVNGITAGATFGVGPNTPCWLAAKAGHGTVSTFKKVLWFVFDNAICPTNYFFFDATFSWQHGQSFTGGPATADSESLKLEGKLSLLGLVQLSSVEADVTSDPFNMHFDASPVDFIVPGLALTLKISLSGNLGALGFEIGLQGKMSVLGHELANAGGVISTEGMGACASFLESSIGGGGLWNDAPQIFESGCDAQLNKYRVVKK